MGNIIFAVVIFAIVAAILAGLVRSIRIQHEGKVGVVESWGRFSRVIAPGRYILWPWERVVGEMPLQMFEWETPPQKLMLRGGAPMTITAVIYYQIEHAHKTAGGPRPPRVIGTTPAPVGSVAHDHTPSVDIPSLTNRSRAGLGVDSLEPGARTGAQRRQSAPAMLRNTSATLINRITGRGTSQLDVTHAAYRAKYIVHDWQEATHKEAVATLQQVFSRVGVGEDITNDINWQETLGHRVAEHLNEKAQAWGVHILDVTFKDPALSEMTLQNLNAEARATREGRVREREAESYRKVAEILNLSPADLMRWREVEIMRELSKNQPRVMFNAGMSQAARISDNPIAGANAQNPLLPMMAGGERDLPAGAAAAGPPGYLGSEPPTPALSSGSLTVSPSAVTTGMVAPSLSRVDQQ
jgi:regulator of protease activity HflC (stomatin/prohibitin superfamily)